MDGRLWSSRGEHFYQLGKTSRKVLCMVLLLHIHLINSDLQTGQFLIHKNKILTTSLSMISTEESSLQRCAAECLKSKSCCVCSYNESTKVCVTDTSGCCNVQTKSSEESVVMVRENKGLFVYICFCNSKRNSISVYIVYYEPCKYYYRNGDFEVGVVKFRQY